MSQRDLKPLRVKPLHVTCAAALIATLQTAGA